MYIYRGKWRAKQTPKVARKVNQYSHVRVKRAQKLAGTGAAQSVQGSEGIFCSAYETGKVPIEFHQLKSIFFTLCEQ
jgi:hypothetical protein